MHIDVINEIENKTSNNPLISLTSIYRAIKYIAGITHECACIHALQTIAADLLLMYCDKQKYSLVMNQTNLRN
jgi:hypothetical protein